MAKRIHIIEVTVDDSRDENETWLTIGGALTDAGFDAVLYGETVPLETEETTVCRNCGRDAYVMGDGCPGCNWIDDDLEDASASDMSERSE